MSLVSTLTKRINADRPLIAAICSASAALGSDHLPPKSRVRLAALSAKGILKPSDRVAYLAGSLVGFAFGLELGIASDLASRLLDSAFGLLR
jgi:hypothetical protein